MLRPAPRGHVLRESRLYSVKEIFYTLQGEGMNAGRPAVFCRFSGCNLWSGREKDRPSAVCRFCDTDFVGTDGPGGGKHSTAEDLAGAVARTWAGDDTTNKLVVLTGGEPLLQVDAALTGALHREGFAIALETNGTIDLPPGIDWVTVSPKADAEVVVTKGDELKLVHPQLDVDPERFSKLDFRHFLLQPMDGPDRPRAVEARVRYCLAHPRWRLSLQTHKMIGIP